MIVSHKIALDVTDAQRTWFSQQCGYARFAYNPALAASNKEPRPWKVLNKHFNAKALSDSALGGFLARLKSKAEVLGIPIIEA